MLQPLALMLILWLWRSHMQPPLSTTQATDPSVKERLNPGDALSRLFVASKTMSNTKLVVSSRCNQAKNSPKSFYFQRQIALEMCRFRRSYRRCTFTAGPRLLTLHHDSYTILTLSTNRSSRGKARWRTSHRCDPISLRFFPSRIDF